MEKVKAWVMNQYATEPKRTIALSIIAAMTIVAVIVGVVSGL
jgi:hypothetical protein